MCSESRQAGRGKPCSLSHAGRLPMAAVAELEGGKQGPGPCKIFDLFHFLDTKREKKE